MYIYSFSRHLPLRRSILYTVLYFAFSLSISWRSGIQDQAGQHGKTPSQNKIYLLQGGHNSAHNVFFIPSLTSFPRKLLFNSYLFSIHLEITHSHAFHIYESLMLDFSTSDSIFQCVMIIDDPFSSSFQVSFLHFAEGIFFRKDA